MISIIIPTYNNSQQLVGTVQSISKQSYDNIEIVIIDDASIDSSIFGTGKFFKEQSDAKKDNIYSDVDDAIKQSTKIEE